MKLIKAYIRYRKVEEVHNALRAAGFDSMTFVEAEGTGQYTDKEETHISEKYPFAEAYRVIKLEVLVADKQENKIIKIIRDNGRTGYRGDGMILVAPIDEAYKIRNEGKGVQSI